MSCTARAASLRQRHSTLPLTDSDQSSPSQPLTSKSTFVPTKFSSRDLLSAIPKHCFERSAIKSSLYLGSDVLAVIALCWAVSHFDSGVWEKSAVVKWVAWSVYWVLSGWIWTGIWVIAHECGHQAYSPSKTLNNTIGLVSHSLLLVPYHSWRISHARHHTGTNHMTREEVFVPNTRGSLLKTPIGGMELEELVEDTPAFRLLALIGQQTFGWPLYLLTNVTGQPTLPAGTNHFNPSSPLFQPRQKPQIILSDTALIFVFGLLYILKSHIGWIGLTKYYIIPYFMVNHWLVMIVYLQHTDPTIPHYTAKEWTLARGTLSTIDRTLMGPIGRIFFHSICETHVAHHVCVRIPHYNAYEATLALRELLGDEYKSTNENIFISLWKNFKACRFVEDEGDILFYKDGAGKSQVQLDVENVVDSGVEMSGCTEGTEG